MDGKEKCRYVKDVLLSLLGGYVITFLGVVILALLLLFLQISENVVDIGVIILYICSCFFAGFVVGKRRKSKKFLWGMLTGICYYILLTALSLVLGNSLETDYHGIITSMFLCIGSGTLGGMLS